MLMKPSCQRDTINRTTGGLIFTGFFGAEKADSM